MRLMRSFGLLVVAKLPTLGGSCISADKHPVERPG